MAKLSPVGLEVLAERYLQRERWGDDHDDQHAHGALPAVAAFLAHPGVDASPDCGCREAMCPHLKLVESVEMPAPDWARGLWRKHDRRGRAPR